ncbi:MAG: universal stress protein, partial [Desulfobacteraceae bacterium]
MQNNNNKNKLLVAIDGSKQAMKAVHYVAAVFSPKTTHIVLFHVSEPMSDLFSEIKNNQFYQTKLPRLRNWVADEQKHITEYMQKALAHLITAGFSEKQIQIKITPKKLDITRDIVKESYQQYDAVVVGRTGVSRFKDYLIKSVALKLVGQIKHIPVIVIGGSPASKRICIGFDGSDCAMKGVNWVSRLLGASDCKIQLLSLLSHKGKFWLNGKEYFLPTDQDNAFEKGYKVVSPCVNSAKE